MILINGVSLLLPALLNRKASLFNDNCLQALISHINSLFSVTLQASKLREKFNNRPNERLFGGEASLCASKENYLFNEVRFVAQQAIIFQWLDSRTARAIY